MELTRKEPDPGSNGKLFGTTTTEDKWRRFSFQFRCCQYILQADGFCKPWMLGFFLRYFRNRSKTIADNIPVTPVQNMDGFVTYPNPVTDNVTISANLTSETQVEIWDTRERIVDFTLQGITNVSMLPSGFYSEIPGI